MSILVLGIILMVLSKYYNFFKKTLNLIIIIMCVCLSLSQVWLFATPWIVAHKVLLCMWFSRQEYWSGLPFPSSGDLPNSGIEPRSHALQEDDLLFELLGIAFNSTVNITAIHNGL